MPEGKTVRGPRSKNRACANAEWLAAHYLERDAYLEWCSEKEIDPEPDGGKGLDALGCGRAAGVTNMTIYKWMRWFGVPIRGRRSNRVHPNSREAVRKYNLARTSGPWATGRVAQWRARKVQAIKARRLHQE